MTVAAPLGSAHEQPGDDARRHTIETGDFTYGFETPLSWIGPAGVLQDFTGVPDCLAADGTHDGVRFAWTTVPELGTRVVVAVGCR